jgi:hypothetical protein
MKQQRKEGEFTIHENNTKTTVTATFAKTETEPYIKEYGKAFGCAVNVALEKPVCNVWTESRGTGDFRQRCFEFEPAEPSAHKEAEAFAVVEKGWTLRLYQWTDTASYSLEVWKGDTFKGAVEWWNHKDGAVTAYAEGDLSSFVEFAEQVIKSK